MAVRVYVHGPANNIEVQHFAQAVGWVEKDNGALSVLNPKGEAALFKRWDYVVMSD